jgi:EamA domain-containing membrane protein RarD
MTAVFNHHLQLLIACIIYGTVGIYMQWLGDMSVGSIIFYRVLFGLSAILLYLAVTGNLGQLALKKKEKLPAPSGNPLCLTNVFLLLGNSLFRSFFSRLAALYRSYLSDNPCTSLAW